MSIDAVTPLRRRMIEDMNARKLGAGTQRGHIRSCKRFAAFLKRSPDTAKALALFGRRPPQRVVRPSSRQPKTCTTAEQLDYQAYRTTPLPA
jgi:hypothetical protein